MCPVITRDKVGDAVIGMTLDAVKAVLGEPQNLHERGGMVFASFPGLVVTTSKERVNMLIVESSEVGNTELGVSVGMSWIELDRRVGPLEYVSDSALWASSKTPGISYEIARPTRDDEESEELFDSPIVTELYEVTDPKNAIVRRIYVM
jgi:hypothetical protein